MSNARPILLLDASPVYDVAHLEQLGPGSIFACDFPIARAEYGDEIPGGYRLGRVVNIDHHAPTPRMARRISSANLALEFIGEFGPVPSDATVVINHTDCDSILSSGIASGRLEPDPAFGDAAVAADHTGERNDIADLLQSMESWRDAGASFRNLDALLRGASLDAAAQAALDSRRERRHAVDRLVRDGLVTMHNGIAFADLPAPADGEFFPALLPDATLILITFPRHGSPGTWDVKVRLGDAAPSWLTLDMLKIREWDRHYGGRWNAGSNRRSGGTSIPPTEYLAALAGRLDRTIGMSGAGTLPC